MTKKEKRPMFTLIIILLGLFILSNIFASYIENRSNRGTENGNVAVIEIKGLILGDSASGLLSDTTASSSKIVRQIEDACNDPLTEAIVLEINSGGGSPVASDEIATTVKDCGKPTVAWIREAGASGAYWIATAADHVIAHPLSITGSIGVRGSYLDFSGLLRRYNITYQRLVAGKYKDAGSPYKQLTPEEERILQGKINLIHDAFIKEIANNRNKTKEYVTDHADGMFLLGEEAYDLGLVDELGGKKEVKEYLQKELNTTIDFFYIKEEFTLTDLLSSISEKHGFAIGEGVASKLTSRQGIFA